MSITHQTNEYNQALEAIVAIKSMKGDKNLNQPI